MAFWPMVVIGIWKEGSMFDIVGYHRDKAFLKSKTMFARYTTL